MFKSFIVQLKELQDFVKFQKNIQNTQRACQIEFDISIRITKELFVVNLKNLILKTVLSSLLLVFTACDNTSRRIEHKDSVVVDLQNLAKSKESLEDMGIRVVKKKASNGTETVEVSLEDLENEIAKTRTTSEAISYTQSAMSTVDDYVENSETALKSRHLGTPEKKAIKAELLAVQEATEVMKSKLQSLKSKNIKDGSIKKDDDLKKESGSAHANNDDQSKDATVQSDSQEHKGSVDKEGSLESTEKSDTDKVLEKDASSNSSNTAIAAAATAVVAGTVSAVEGSENKTKNAPDSSETSAETSAAAGNDVTESSDNEADTAQNEDREELKEHSYSDLVNAIENKECSQISEIFSGIEVAMMLDGLNDSNRTMHDVENKFFAVAALDDKTCAKEVTESLLSSRIDKDVKKLMFHQLQNDVDVNEVLESKVNEADERSTLFVPDFELLKEANYSLFSEEPFPLGVFSAAASEESKTSYMSYLLTHIHTEEGMSADEVESKMTDVLDKLYASYPEETINWVNSESSFNGQSPFVAAAMYNETGIFRALSKVEGAKPNTVDKKTGYNSFEWQHVVNPYYMMNLNLLGVYADSEIKDVLEESGLDPRTDVFGYSYEVGQNKGTQMSTEVDWIYTIANKHIEDMKSKLSESEYPFGNTSKATKLEYIPYKFFK